MTTKLAVASLVALAAAGSFAADFPVPPPRAARSAWPAGGREFTRLVRAGWRTRLPGDGVASGSLPPGTENSGVITPGCVRAWAAAGFGRVGSGSIGVTFLAKDCLHSANAPPLSPS